MTIDKYYRAGDFFGSKWKLPYYKFLGVTMTVEVEDGEGSDDDEDAKGNINDFFNRLKDFWGHVIVFFKEHGYQIFFFILIYVLDFWFNVFGIFCF